jgi:uncharacterized DUF497 family protein
MEDIRFTWDEQKNITNIKKHGISFIEAAKVYFDPERLEIYDEEHSALDEERWNIIGDTGMKILFVVIIKPAENLIRIISARCATKKEQEAYYGNCR